MFHQSLFITKHSICLVLAVSLSACGSTNNTTEAKSTETKTTAASLSQECNNYVAKLKEIAKTDAKIKEIINKSLNDVYGEWQGLNAQEQEMYSQHCQMMIEYLESIDKNTASQ